MAEPVQEVLLAFGVRKRAIQRVIFRNLNLTVEPKSVVALVGASGAGKKHAPSPSLGGRRGRGKNPFPAAIGND
jgi:ABC-type ATPase with predicted acetyltransferase domain